MIDIDAENFRKQNIQVLAIPVGIPSAAPIPDRPIEVSIGTEGKGATVMILKIWMRNGQEDQFGAWVGNIGVTGDREAGQNQGIVSDHILDIKITIRCITRMESERQQTFLAARRKHNLLDVEERRRQEGAVLIDEDQPGPFDNKQP